MVLLGAAVCAGCPLQPREAVPLHVLVAEHNANAAKVPRLWANARVSATFTLESGLPIHWGSTSPLASYNAKLRFWKQPSGPPNFVLVGQEVAQELFRVGIDAPAGLYYMWYNVGDNAQALVGRAALAGAPGVEAIPIDPLQLAEVLGITALPTEPGRLPAVTLQMQKQRPYAYVVNYWDFQPVTGRMKLWRQVLYTWSDQRPRLPFQVRLFDAEGRCRVIADVGRYKPIEWDGPPGDAPVMATDFRILWPGIKDVQRRTSIHLTLEEMSATRPFLRSYFEYRSHLPPGLPETRVDASVAVNSKGPDPQ
ncbi:MAG TPA: hypothetical protein VFJ30_08710 [Phycisphaerae bacterium]|nr:hypothetical protein [Phycisphaerae bacterium]